MVAESARFLIGIDLEQAFLFGRGALVIVTDQRPVPCLVDCTVYRVTYCLLQTLLPQTPPNFAVERVRSCDTGRQVALYGPQGIAVLDVPRRWDRAGKFQAGTKTCR